LSERSPLRCGPPAVRCGPVVHLAARRESVRLGVRHYDALEADLPRRAVGVAPPAPYVSAELLVSSRTLDCWPKLYLWNHSGIVLGTRRVTERCQFRQEKYESLTVMLVWSFLELGSQTSCGPYGLQRTTNANGSLHVGRRQPCRPPTRSCPGSAPPATRRSCGCAPRTGFGRRSRQAFEPLSGNTADRARGAGDFHGLHVQPALVLVLVRAVLTRPKICRTRFSSRHPHRTLSLFSPSSSFQDEWRFMSPLGVLR